MLVRQRNTGNQYDLLECVSGRGGAGIDRISLFPTPPREHKQTGWFDGAGGRLYSPMSMREQRGAVRVEEVGGSERSQIGSKLRHDRKTRLEGRRRRG